MKVALLSLLVAAKATETVSAQRIFIRRNDGNHVQALFDEESMSLAADYMVSVSLSFGDDSSMSMGKAVKLASSEFIWDQVHVAKALLAKSGKKDTRSPDGTRSPTGSKGNKKHGSKTATTKSTETEAGKAVAPTKPPPQSRPATFETAVATSHTYSPTYFPTLFPTLSPT
jgi:hypothetical protein